MSRLPGTYWFGAGIISCPYLVSTSSTRSRGLVLPKVMLAWLVLSFQDQYQWTFQYPPWCQLLEVCTSVGQVCWPSSGMYQGMFQGMWAPDQRVSVVQKIWNDLHRWVSPHSYADKSLAHYGHLVYEARQINVP